MAKWLIEDKELLYADDAGIIHQVKATDVWKVFNGQTSDLPSVEVMGLRCSSKYLDPALELVDSGQSPFGVLKLVTKSRFGKTIVLGDKHRSDHVTDNGIWAPLFESTFREIIEYLCGRSISIGKPLSAREYLTCVRDLHEYDWFTNSRAFSANEWSANHDAADHVDPPMFVATLADYQKRGSDWLTMMRRNEVGVVLGDSMGLGKTVQAIKAICDLISEKPASRTLIICPTALVENWARELEKFTRGLTYMLHVGPDRTRNYREYTSSVMITTYDVARMDIGVLSLIQWDLVILDEAQFIKNPKSQRTRAVKRIPCVTAIAITGTPFENHVTDIWSIFDFCVPRFLGSETQFSAQYNDDEASAAVLGEVIAPLLLRRTLDDVPNDLPPIITIPIPIALSGTEAEEYEQRKKRYTESGNALGAIGNLITDLSAPMSSNRHLSNLKFDYFETVMGEIIARKEKVIVFAERQATIGAIQDKYERRLPVFVLSGKTPVSERQQVVDRYSGVQGSAMLICNPVVGGAGLNITAANHVFHFSMQWNPAKFDQADARAHRRGQIKTVVAHYPYYVSTIEEYMWAKVAVKRGLASEIVIGNKAVSTVQDASLALALSPTEQVHRPRS